MGLLASGVHIKVSTDVLNNKAVEAAKEIEGVKRDFDTLKQTVKSSSSYWIGEAGDLHRRLFEDQSDDIDEIIKRLSEHPADLQQIAGVYASTEAEVQAISGELPTDVLF